MRLIRRIVYLIFFVALVVTVGMFISQNNKPISIELFHWQTSSLPMYLLVFLAMMLGAAATGFLALWELVRVEGRARKLAKRLKLSEKEYAALKKSLPEVEEKKTEEKKEKEDLSQSQRDDYAIHQSDIQSFKKIP